MMFAVPNKLVGNYPLTSRRWEMPRYYDYEWNECQFSVRRTGIREFPLIRNLPYRNLDTYFKVVIKNKSLTSKEVTCKWSILEKENKLIQEGFVICNIGKQGTLKQNLGNERFKFPGSYSLSIHLDIWNEPTLVEFNIPEVLDSVIHSVGIKVGIGAIGVVIGTAITLLIQKLVS